MDKVELLTLALRLADEIDNQADEQRERALKEARMKYDMNDHEEVDIWTRALPTSYQTLRGVAAAIRAALSPTGDNHAD